MGVKGKAGRTGRFKKDVEDLLGETRLRAIVLINRYLKNPDIPLADKVTKVAVPMALKMIPDKIQAKIETRHTLDPQLAAQFLEVFKQNRKIYEDLETLELQRSPQLALPEGLQEGSEQGSAAYSLDSAGQGLTLCPPSSLPASPSAEPSASPAAEPSTALERAEARLGMQSEPTAEEPC